jgi:hypothetical protein
MVGRAIVAKGARSDRRRTPRPDIVVALSRLCTHVGLFLLPMIDLRVTRSLQVSDALFAVAAVALALTLRAPARAPRTTAWFFGAFLFVVGGVLASYDAFSSLGSLQVVANGVFVLIVWQWTIRHVIDSPRRTQSAMAAYILGATVSAGAAVIQAVFHTTLGLRAAAGSTSRAVGLAQQPNIAAVTFAIAIVLAIGVAIDKRRGQHFWLRVLAIVVLGLATMFTGSVSGMVATLVGLFILLARRGFQIRNLLAVAAVLVGIYYAGTHLEVHVGSANLNPFARIHATTGQNTGYNTVSPRFAMYRTVWGRIEESPLVGHGLDTRSSYVYYDPYLGVSYPTHNFVLLLWYEGGILFVLGAALTMGSSVARLVRQPGSATRDAILSAAVVVLVYSMAGPELFDRWLWLPFVLALTVRGGRSPTPMPAIPVES